MRLVSQEKWLVPMRECLVSKGECLVLRGFEELRVLKRMKRGIVRKHFSGSFYDEVHQTGESVVFALCPRNADKFVPPFWVQVKDFGEIAPKGIAVCVEFSVSQLVCESGHKGLQRCPLLEKRLEGRVLQEFL